MGEVRFASEYQPISRDVPIEEATGFMLSETNEVQLLGWVRRLMRRHQINSQEALLSGFDGGENVELTIRRPKDMIYGVDLATWDEVVNRRAVLPEEWRMRDPVIATIYAQTPCIGIYEVQGLHPLYEEPEKQKWMPQYWHSGGDVNQALRGVLIFKRQDSL